MTVTDSGAAIKPRVPTYKKEATYEPPSPAVLNGAVASSPSPDLPIKIRSIEEAPRHGPAGTSDVLVGAVQKIFQAVTAQIAYHEREAQKLRDSLKPFSTLAPRPNVAPDDGSSAQAIRAVLDLADQLNLNGEQKS
jgi:hypothetical protein